MCVSWLLVILRDSYSHHYTISKLDGQWFWHRAVKLFTKLGHHEDQHESKDCCIEPGYMQLSCHLVNKYETRTAWHRASFVVSDTTCCFVHLCLMSDYEKKLYILQNISVTALKDMGLLLSSDISEGDQVSPFPSFGLCQQTSVLSSTIVFSI